MVWMIKIYVTFIRCDSFLFRSMWSCYSIPSARLGDKSLLKLTNFFPPLKDEHRSGENSCETKCSCSCRDKRMSKAQEGLYLLNFAWRIYFNVEHKKRWKRVCEKFFISSFTWKFFSDKFDMPNNIKSNSFLEIIMIADE